MSCYEELRRILDCHPSGCVESSEIIEILKILFTEEEAKIAIGLGFRPFPLNIIAEKLGMQQDYVFKHLEALSNKGVVFAKKKDEVWHYALLPVMPGLFEFPYMKNEPNPLLERLTDLWKKYMKKLGKEFGSHSMSFSRIIPIQESILSKPDILPYEMLNDMIDKANVVGIGKCACRSSEQNCDNPKEACMLFDDTCTYLVERGFGRYITKEEMKDKLKEFDKLGLIHQTNNAKDRLTFICNCCPCCCGLLRAYTEIGNPNVVLFSGFIPECDDKKCIGCANCADERCPMRSINMENNLPVIDKNRCIGCGLCVTGCPENALKLVRIENNKEVAATNRDMGLRILQDKGRLNDFLPYIMPLVQP